MLELDQLPPPCKGGLVDSQPFVVVQISLQIGIFSFLSRSGCSPLFVWVGVLVGVHNLWGKTNALAFLYHLQPLQVPSVGFKPATYGIEVRWHVYIPAQWRKGNRTLAGPPLLRCP